MKERIIRPELVSFLDKKLKSNGVAQHALFHKDARLLFACAAEALVGIRERGGSNKGTLVELIQDTVGGINREPWCMSAVQSLIAYVEKKLNVESPVYVSEHCLTVWNKTPEDQRVRYYPLPGAITIWQHGFSSAGHTGVVGATDGNKFYSYEGNTGKGIDDDGDVVREGDGFYFVKRDIHGSGTMRVKGFLKPF